MLSKFYKYFVFSCIFISFTWFFSNRTQKVVSGEHTCIAAYDSFGYYMYLPHFLEKKNLYFTQDWLVKNQKDRYDCIPYQLHQRENGNYLDIYHMGLSFVQMPSFLVGHLAAKITNSPEDGFSKPYYLANLWNAYLFIFLGLLYLFKLSRLFFTQNIAVTLLACMVFGTNYYFTATESYGLTHVYLFALIAMFAYHFFKSVQTPVINKKHFYYSAFFLGLCSVIRPTHVLLFILPMVYLWKYFPDRKTYFKTLLIFPIASIIWNIPQLLYWKIVGGSWLILNMHTEDIVLTDPNFWKFLVSYRKGWFVYTPIMLFIFGGFYHLFKQRKKELFWTLLSCLFIFIWVFCSWECWHYAGSYGTRVMVDLYPLCAILLGVAFTEIAKVQWKKITVIAFVLFASFINCITFYQYFEYRFFSIDRMTKAHFWYIFGKTNIPDFTRHRLLIDRGDLNWPQAYRDLKDPNYQVISKRIYSKNNFPITNAGFGINDIFWNSFTETDECQIQAIIEYTATDSTKGNELKMESTNKYNTFHWPTLELTNGKQLHKRRTDTLTFNAPEFRHRVDRIQMYIYRTDTAYLKIHSIRINATMLIRKD